MQLQLYGVAKMASSPPSPSESDRLATDFLLSPAIAASMYSQDLPDSPLYLPSPTDSPMLLPLPLLGEMESMRTAFLGDGSLPDDQGLEEGMGWVIDIDEEGRGDGSSCRTSSKQPTFSLAGSDPVDDSSSPATSPSQIAELTTSIGDLSMKPEGEEIVEEGESSDPRRARRTLSNLGEERYENRELEIQEDAQTAENGHSIGSQ